MKGSLAVVIAAAVAAGIVLGALYGVAGGGETAALLVAVGVPGLSLAHLAAARRRRLALRRQFAVGIGLAVGSILVATVAGALLMFVSNHDAAIVAVITVFAGVLAARAAGLVATGVLADVRQISRGIAAVGEGRRDQRLGLAGRDELTGLAGEADAMVDRLAAEEARAAGAERARRDLVAAASHDLRTPVSALRLIVDALDDDLVDEQTRRRYQRTMRTHIGALGTLIDDLFELTRLQAGDITWSLQQVHVAELVEDTVQALSTTAQARGVALAAEVTDRGVRAHADAEKVQRVLFNLVHNAIRHTPADGSVTIHVNPLPEGTEIEVADTGDGIDPADRARVFEPFYRAGPDAARSTDGAGLGLAISRAIVEAHGGRIWIEPAPVGTRVRFTLPTERPLRSLRSGSALR